MNVKSIQENLNGTNQLLEIGWMEFYSNWFLVFSAKGVPIISCLPWTYLRGNLPVPWKMPLNKYGGYWESSWPIPEPLKNCEKEAYTFFWELCIALLLHTVYFYQIFPQSNSWRVSPLLAPAKAFAENLFNCARQNWTWILSCHLWNICLFE